MNDVTLFFRGIRVGFFQLFDTLANIIDSIYDGISKLWRFFADGPLFYFLFYLILTTCAAYPSSLPGTWARRHDTRHLLPRRGLVGASAQEAALEPNSQERAGSPSEALDPAVRQTSR